MRGSVYWNCRGVSGRTFSRILKDIVNKHGIKVMGFVETRISGTKADNVIRRLWFNDWIRAEAMGFVGGIWVLWNSWETDLEYLFSSTQLAHCQISDRSSGTWMSVTFVYDDTNFCDRQSMWNDFTHLVSQAEGPWLIIGDFNTFLDNNDKVGGL